MSDNWGVRAALRLYPAAYRGERGAELAGVHEEVTADAGRWERLRSLGDLAGYGLRLRSGLGSAGIPARLLAVAAPFAAGALAGDALYLAETVVTSPWGYLRVELLGNGGLSTLLGRVPLLVLALASAAALFGRWTFARAAAAVGAAALLLAGAGIFLAAAHRIGGTDAMLGTMVIGGPQALWALMLLAAPRDLLPPVTWRTVAGVLAGALLAGPVMFEVLYGLPGLGYLLKLPALRFLGPALLVVGLALMVAAVPALLRGRLFPVAAVVAVAPMLLLGLLPYAVRSPLGFGGAALLVAAVAAGAVLLGRYWHPAVPRRRAPRG